MTARVVAAAIAIVAAFAIGRLTVAPGPPTERIVERGGVRTIIERSHHRTEPDEVRRVIREELARTAAAAPPAVDDAISGDRDTSPPADDRTVVVAEARAALAAGMADRRWSDDDRTRLRGALLVLSPREADAIFDELLTALNAGDLQPDVHGPPI